MTLPQAFELALQHHQAGRLAEAEALYRQILAVEPRHADALHLLGVIAHQVGRHDVAVDLIGQAIAVNPHRPDWSSNLGEAHRKLGHRDEAIAAYRQALALKPDLPEPWTNLGLVLCDKGEFDEAAAACRRALELRPDLAEAHANLGNVLGSTGHLEEAIAAYHRAIELKPDFAIAHNNLGILLNDQGRAEEAIAAYRRALQLKPDYAAASNNLGNALRNCCDLDAAVAACRRAIDLEPDYALAHNNLGNALNDGGQVEEAIASYRRAIELEPDSSYAHCNVLLSLHYLAGFDPEALFAEHCRWDEIHARPLARFIEPPGNDPDPERRLRIGYVSPDFREHPVTIFFENLLENHDRARVEVFCYACLPHADLVTARLREKAGHWRTVHGLSDARAAELIRSDRIDILVDLAGHSAGNRLTIFARHPAPVQVSYLGYNDTTGLRAMDYRLTDVHADPPGATEHLHTEQLIRLPDCAWSFRPRSEAPPVLASPCLGAGHVTFGCFNALPKLNAATLGLWSRILSALPGSRLLLKNHAFREPSVQGRIRARLEKAGIASERVGMLAPTAGFAEHLAAYNQVDIALDTFPYHGTTTTCEALWMGVPVVTLAGRTHASRVGVSLLTNVGLPELIASHEDDYVRLAADLAADQPRLAQLRATLRERMGASPLMDGPRLARDIEEAYRQMWRRWCLEKTTARP